MFDLDVAQSHAAFSLADVLHTMHGAFKVKRGSVNFDLAAGACSGESKVEIDGTFTIHGAPHPLTATAVVNISGDRMRVKVHFAVPHVAWGMKNPSTLFLKVGDTVDIDLDASGRVFWKK